ncbi:hypothetical protein HYX16_02215 [Candidatus Woesearchaeota archaeon]|nr:hypothetical protein [Candidatus Woesearchaeota archaeon]
MHKERTQKNIYKACEEEGSFIPLMEVNIEKIKSMLMTVSADLNSSKNWIKNAEKESDQWNAIFKINYDCLHILTEAFLIFDKLKIRTHECLFTYLCEKHSELEFSWDFFEKIRTKRNGSIYYGKLITYKDWEEIQLQLNLYINSLKKEIEAKLKDFEAED